MLFAKFGKQDIHSGLEECREVGGVLLDVRERDEFAGGHIPGAVNVPLSDIKNIGIDKNKKLFVYCLSGIRSKRAAGVLKAMGYNAVKSIGGIKSYKGPVEK